jgi:hypothetical protein
MVPGEKTGSPEPELRPLYEAICEVCSLDYSLLSDALKVQVGICESYLKSVGATPEDVRAGASRWPWNVPITPMGLKKWWARLGPSSPPARPDPPLEPFEPCRHFTTDNHRRYDGRGWCEECIHERGPLE